MVALAQWLIFLSLLVASPAWSAIEKTNQSSSRCTGAPCASHTFSMTVPSGSDFLIVDVPYFAVNPTGVTSITFNGSAATRVDGASVSCSGGICGVEKWRLVAPDAGTYDLAVTMSAAVNLIVIGSSYAGVDQVTPLGTPQVLTGSSAVPSLTFSSQTTEVISGAIAMVNAGTLSPAGSATQLALEFDLGGFIRGAASFMIGAPSANYGWGNTSDQLFAMVAVALMPSGGSGAPPADDITYDTHSISSDITSGTELSWTITPGSACNFLLIGAGARHTTTAPTLSTVTVAGGAATKIRRDVGGTGVAASELWYAVGFLTGSPLTIVATYGAAIDDVAAGTALCLTNVNIAGPIDISAGGNGSTDPSTDITPTVDKAFVVDAVYSHLDSGLTAAGGQTARGYRALVGAVSVDSFGLSQKGPITPAALTNMAWAGADNQWVQSVVALRPTSAPASDALTELLLWTDNATNESLFRLQWKHATQPTYGDLAVLPANSGSYLSQYTTQVDRCYRIRAENSGGNSLFSNELCSAITAVGPIQTPLPVPTIGGGLADAF